MTVTSSIGYIDRVPATSLKLEPGVISAFHSGHKFTSGQQNHAVPKPKAQPQQSIPSGSAGQPSLAEIHALYHTVPKPIAPKIPPQPTLAETRAVLKPTASTTPLQIVAHPTTTKTIEPKSLVYPTPNVVPNHFTLDESSLVYIHPKAYLPKPTAASAGSGSQRVNTAATRLFTAAASLPTATASVVPTPAYSVTAPAAPAPIQTPVAISLPYPSLNCQTTPAYAITNPVKQKPKLQFKPIQQPRFHQLAFTTLQPQPSFAPTSFTQPNFGSNPSVSKATFPIFTSLSAAGLVNPMTDWPSNTVVSPFTSNAGFPTLPNCDQFTPAQVGLTENPMPKPVISVVPAEGFVPLIANPVTAEISPAVLKDNPPVVENSTPKTSTLLQHLTDQISRNLPVNDFAPSAPPATPVEVTSSSFSAGFVCLNTVFDVKKENKRKYSEIERVRNLQQQRAIAEAFLLKNLGNYKAASTEQLQDPVNARLVKICEEIRPFKRVKA